MYQLHLNFLNPLSQLFVVPVWWDCMPAGAITAPPSPSMGGRGSRRSCLRALQLRPYLLQDGPHLMHLHSVLGEAALHRIHASDGLHSTAQ